MNQSQIKPKSKEQKIKEIVKETNDMLEARSKKGKKKVITTIEDKDEESSIEDMDHNKLDNKNLHNDYEVLADDNTAKYKKFYEEEFTETHLNVQEVPLDFEGGEYNFEGAQKRIDYIIEILSDFSNLNKHHRPRSHYIDLLKLELKNLYDYNDDVIEMLFNLLSPKDAMEFIKTCEQEMPLTIRTNSLKSKRKELARTLIARGVNLDPVSTWDSTGLKIIKSNVPLGATPEYLAGHYIIQAPSSFVPVQAMDVQPGENILDLCAAPGGKSSHIAMLMKNLGELWVNDPDPERCKAVKFNLSRMGVKNHVVVSMDGRLLPKYVEKFDRVLVDAPCSGLGVISKDKSIKHNRNVKDIERSAKTQKQLLLAAIDLTEANSKTGGIIVYSTCSVSLDENERVVQYALEKRDVKLVDIKIDVGDPGFKRCGGFIFDDSMAKTKRIWPQKHQMDGFFIAKLQKVSNYISKEHANTSMQHEKKHQYFEDVVVNKDGKDKKKKIKSKKNGNDLKRKRGDVNSISLYKSKLRKIRELAEFFKTRKIAEDSKSTIDMNGYQKYKDLKGFRVIERENQSNNYPNDGDTVTIHYDLFLLNGQKLDTSKFGKPLKFKLGNGEMIKGWEEGLKGISKGEKCTLVCGYDYGYGENEVNGIPAYSTLVFKIHYIK